MSEHKCIDCGFLAARNVQTRELDEVEKVFRETGEPARIKSIQAQAQSWGPDTPKNEPFPICFRQKRDLITEAKAIGKNNSESVRQVIQIEKECDSFTEWKQGFTPKEHQDKLDRQWMLEYQEKQRDKDKKWEAKQRLQLVIIAGIFTIIGALIGIFLKPC